MPHIVVDDDQARLILESVGNFEIRDQSGNHLGYVAQGFTAEDIAIAKQRMESEEPRFTTKQVLDHLQSLSHRAAADAQALFDAVRFGTEAPRQGADATTAAERRGSIDLQTAAFFLL